jgi:hypothetical protein
MRTPERQSRQRTHAVATLLAAASVICGCAPVHAPRAMHPPVERLERFVYGGWAELDVRQNGSRWTLRGELIAVDSGSVVIMVGDSARRIEMSEIDYASVDLHDRDGGDIAAWTALGALSTLSHGWFLVFTAPMWLVGGTASAVAAGNSGFESENVPRARWWRERAPYARFPQGTPPGLVLESLKPYSASMNAQSGDGSDSTLVVPPDSVRSRR